MKVLFVCTANICRSPVAERVLQRHLESAGWDVVVRSAGTHASRLTVHRDTLAAAATMGIDLADHVSRAVDRPLLHDDGADLIVVMTREHLRDVVALDPTVWGRTFTLKELVRRGEAAGRRRADESVQTWLSRAGSGRRPMELLGESSDDNVADPYLGSPKVYAACIAELDDLVQRLVDLVWPIAREGVA